MEQKIIVESMAHLKEICDMKIFGKFFIILNGGIRSSKLIRYFKHDNTFTVYHSIDNTWDRFISEEQLEELTNIPKAIERRSLIYEGPNSRPR
jgi:hypothetical protein